MAESPREDLVAQQYQKWTYPEPIQNLETWLADNWQWFDPSHAHRVLWPDRAPRADLDILIAGCGTNQAAVFAYTNPAAKVVAVDVSQPSLDHQKFLRDKYSLKNLELHLLPIEELTTLGKDFDLVVSTGVLHHMDNSKAGMKAIADVLRPDGVAAIMLYARYGRAGVELMQAVFRDMGLKQDEESLEMVKAGVRTLAPGHPLHAYIPIADDLNYDAGVVDTFLHGRDVSFTVDDCLDLVTSAGLVFQNWFQNKTYYPPVFNNPDNEFYAAVDRLPREAMWSVMERINTVNACHFFMATHPHRPESSYRIDFSSPAVLDYVPVFRYRCGLNAQGMFRPGWNVNPPPAYRAMLEQVDGERSIREIAARMTQIGRVDVDEAELERIAVALTEALWRTDFLAIDLSRTA